MNHSRPFLGFGLGLRPEHYEDILLTQPKIDWFEIITENYLLEGGKPLYYLDQIRKNYSIMMHGVSLSIGSSDPLDYHYLQKVKELALKIEPLWISDHLCWTGVNGQHVHDLLPLPFTEETIQHVVSRIQKVQEFLDRRILIENISSYVTYQHSEMTESEFISEIAHRADCYILLDVNNVYVNAINHQFNPLDFLKNIPSERIYQIHLAGHSTSGNYIIDSHDSPIIKSVWELYAETLKKFGAISTLIERDDRIPPLQEMLKELDFARFIAKNIFPHPSYPIEFAGF
ncbi:MAG TPA: DUF692 domain-containing protein [Gammaproteobacteria bacterium]|jgi:hypothetical protein|nr:DUF692 domain-containing protein [Gammaproteobacteria bacterium]